MCDGPEDCPGDTCLSQVGLCSDGYFVEEPMPMACPGGPAMVPQVSGTPECPSDKNHMGCACSPANQSAACWPGARKNRNRGICKDGITTCKPTQGGPQWGSCEGFVLPDLKGQTPKERCECFSGGQWKLTNLSPCYVKDSDESVIGAISTINGLCPDFAKLPLKPPTQAFSENVLTVDCGGRFKLCYEIKAGNAAKPDPSDCSVVKVCTEADYDLAYGATPAGKAFPPLPGWATTTPEQAACVAKLSKEGGYGEMTVAGVSSECESIETRVFNRVVICAEICNTDPLNPLCVNCQKGGDGKF